MINEETLQLHTFLLLALNAIGELGIREEDLLVRTRTASWRMLTLPMLQAELRALADKQYVLSYQPALGQARWKLAGLGRAALQEQGLA